MCDGSIRALFSPHTSHGFSQDLIHSTAAKEHGRKRPGDGSEDEVDTFQDVKPIVRQESSTCREWLGFRSYRYAFGVLSAKQTWSENHANVLHKESF